MIQPRQLRRRLVIIVPVAAADMPIEAVSPFGTLAERSRPSADSIEAPAKCAPADATAPRPQKHLRTMRAAAGTDYEPAAGS